MISDKINEVINEQINKEFYSGYLYLSMSAYLKELGLFGFSSWLRSQAKEEVEHGLKLFDYLIDRNSFVTLKQIRMPDFKFTNVISVFKEIFDHEKSITDSVMKIVKISEEECDKCTLNFIEWFVKEQVEEEKNVKNILKRLQLFGENNSSLLLLDQEILKITQT